MGIFSLISLLLTILFKMPSVIRTIMAIIKLIKSMKGQPFIEDLKIIKQILLLILGIIPVSKPAAKEALDSLKAMLESGDLTELNTLKIDVETKKKKCEGSFCPADTSDSL